MNILPQHRTDLFACFLSGWATTTGRPLDLGILGGHYSLYNIIYINKLSMKCLVGT